MPLPNGRQFLEQVCRNQQDGPWEMPAGIVMRFVPAARATRALCCAFWSKRCFLLFWARDARKQHLFRSMELVLRQVRLVVVRIPRNTPFLFSASAPRTPRRSHRASNAPCRRSDRLPGRNLDVAAAPAAAERAAADVRLRLDAFVLLSQWIVARRRHCHPAEVELEPDRGLGRVTDLKLQNIGLLGSFKRTATAGDKAFLCKNIKNGFET